MYNHIFESLAIPQSEQDQFLAGKCIPTGYVNLTLMCKAGKKKLSHYLENKTTNSRIDHLSSVTGIPVTGLVIIIQGGNPDDQGTWGHIKIALDCSQWVSTEMWYWASDVLEKVLHPDFDANDSQFQEAKFQAEKLWGSLRQLSKDAFFQLGDTIKSYLDSGNASQDEKTYLYSSCQNKINRSLFGKDAKTIREELGIGKAKLNRDHFSVESLRRLDHIQQVSARFARQGQHPLTAIDSALSLYAYDLIKYKD